MSFHDSGQRLSIVTDIAVHKTPGCPEGGEEPVA